VVGKDPVELEKYLEKKFALPEEDFNFVQYIAAFISTVTKYYSSYDAVPFLRKNYKKNKIFLLQSKAILQEIVLRYYFPQSSTVYTINNNKLFRGI
jgi:hypothetical protein